MSMPYRPMQPWWTNPPDATQTVNDHMLFRRAFRGAEWSDGSTPGDGDPRLTPSGDVARRGTIPQYVPFAVVHPGAYTAIPQ